MTRASKRSWLAMILSCLLIFSVISPALAAPAAPLAQDDAISLLKEYQIVQGDQFGNLNLDKPITRAELSKIVVYAMGGGELAPALASSVSFNDAKGHWAAGYIEMASRLNLVKGRDATTFDPDAQITNAEAYTILLRMVGKEPTGPWQPNVIMQAAAMLGITPNLPLDAMANLPTIRGTIFNSLATVIVNVPLADGTTLGRKYLDTTPPTLSVAALPEAAVEDSITISGSTTGAVRVTVNGLAVPLIGGRFETKASLGMTTNTITVIAYDRVGNHAKVERTVVRGGEVARIEVTGPSTVKAGQSVTLSVKPYDSANRLLPSSIVTGSVPAGRGTFDSKTGVFTAGSTAGGVTITFTSGDVTEEFALDVLGLAPEAASLRIRSTQISQGITVGKATQVQVEVLDATGSPITHDEGRPVTLQVTGLAGATPSNSTQTTVQGVASFTVSGSQEGNATLTASSTGLAGATLPIAFTSKTRIVLSADPAEAVADGSTVVTIRASLQDENGNLITNSTGEDIHVTLDVPNFDGYASATSLVIRRGVSTSVGYDGQLVPGYKTERVAVSGSVQSNQKFTVVPVSVSFKEVTIGAATKFDVVGGGGYLKRDVPTTLVVRVTDNQGNTIPKGSFAFQVKARVSGERTSGDELPEGLDITLGDTGLRPTAGEEDGVVARTVDGSARLTLIYDRSGLIEVEIVGVKATNDAYDDRAVIESAVAGTSLSSAKRSMTFVDAVTGVRALVDLPASKLVDQEFGVLAATGRATATIRVYLVDDRGGWVPTASHNVTLSHDSSVTRLSGEKDGKATVRAKNGVAEFTITSSRDVGVDTFTATADTVADTDELDIATYDASLAQPTIIAVTGNRSHEDNRITLDDDGMLIDLASYGGNSYGFAKVYRSGSSTPIFTSDVLDLSASDVSILVPKKSLPVSDRYSVSINNGHSDSPRSFSWPDDTSQKVVVEKATNISITAVRYDAMAKVGSETKSQLIVTARGVSSNGEIDATQLSLYQTVTKERLPLDALGAICTPGNGSFTCSFYGEIDASIFNGSVILDTENGWYRRDAYGETAGRDETVTDNVIKPMAYVDYTALTFTEASTGKITASLTLNGTNLNQGRIDLTKIAVGTEALSTSTYKSSISSTGGNTVMISLHETLASKLYAGTVSKYLDAEAGWLYAGTSDDNASFSGVPVFVTPKVTRVTFDNSTNELVITGINMDGTIDATELRFVDRRGNDIKELNDLVGSLDSAVSAVDSVYRIPLGKDAGTLGAELVASYNRLAYVTSKEPKSSASWYKWNTWLGSPLSRYLLSW